jgi:hypothetical protein
MKTSFFIIAIIAITLTSCKKDGGSKKEDQEAIPKIETKQKFSVDLDIIASKDDNFSVYYTEDRTIAFTGEKAVWTGVIGQSESQKLTLDLPEEVIPTNIRIDFGLNKDQDDVTLEKFKLNFYGKSFEARGSAFFKYFIPNDSIKTEIDQVNGTIKFLKNPKNFSSPFYYPQQAVLDEIEKITN